MRLARITLVLATVTACSAPRPLPCEPHPQITAAPAPAPTSQAASATVPACFPGPPPLRPQWLQAKSSRGLCRRHEKVEAKLERELRKAFDTSTKHSRVDVTFGCDPVLLDADTIVLGGGEGHGGGLWLWRLKRVGEEYEVMGLGHAMPWATYTRDSFERHDRFSVKVAEGKLPASVVDAWLTEARVLATTSIREVEPPRVPNALSLSSASWSGRMLSTIEISDKYQALGRSLLTPFDGTNGTHPLAMEKIADSFWTLVKEFPLQPTTAFKPEQRAFFRSQFLRGSHDRTAPVPWWVTERLTRMAGSLGSEDLVPILVDELRQTLRQAPHRKNKLSDQELLRSTATPINAIVKLTGFDVRYGPDGKVRPTLDIVRDYIDACGIEQQLQSVQPDAALDDDS